MFVLQSWIDSEGSERHTRLQEGRVPLLMRGLSLTVGSHNVLWRGMLTRKFSSSYSQKHSCLACQDGGTPRRHGEFWKLSSICQDWQLLHVEQNPHRRGRQSLVLRVLLNIEAELLDGDKMLYNVWVELKK